MSNTALRKLTEKTRNVEGKLERRSIIQDYTNFDSQTYAPMTRVGVYLDSGSEQYSIKSQFTSTLDGKEGRREEGKREEGGRREEGGGREGGRGGDLMACCLTPEDVHTIFGTVNHASVAMV